MEKGGKNTHASEVSTVAKILIKAKQDMNFPGEKDIIVIKVKCAINLKKCFQKRMKLICKTYLIYKGLESKIYTSNPNDALGDDNKFVAYLDET